MTGVSSEKWFFLITAWSAFFFAAISPGPNMLAVMTRAFGAGRQAAVGVAIGIAIGSFFWAITTTAGIGYVADQIPFLIPLVGLFGGYYLINLGLQRYRLKGENKNALDVTPEINTVFSKDIVHGFIVIASNPKVALFWLSLSAIITKSGINYYYVFVFSLVCAATALTIYTFEALVFSNEQVRSLYFRCQHALDVVFSALFIGIGGYLIWTVLDTILDVA